MIDGFIHGKNKASKLIFILFIHLIFQSVDIVSMPMVYHKFGRIVRKTCFNCR